MSFITKRRLASLASASAIIATVAVAIAPGAALASPSASTGGSAKDGYNSIPSKVSGNVPSYGFQAYSINEFGDIVGLGGTARKLSSMSVDFSSWASQSGSWDAGNAVSAPGATFDVPITFNIYANSDGAKGALLATRTQTVAIAYRPSSDNVRCEGGRWYNSKDKTCYNGLIQTVTMPMTTLTGAPLPEEVIWTVQYNTSTHGPIPTGAPGPADSLNVATKSFDGAPFAGTDLNEDKIFIDSAYLGDTGYTGERPLGAITTK
jgi:hypothetical protein